MRRPFLAAWMLVAMATLAFEGPARADDLVWLKNGGRLRGQVLSEDPKEGVKIKLADGRTRVVPVAEVNKVEYEDASPSAPPAAPGVPAPPPPVAAPKLGSVVIDAAEPGRLWFDGVEVGQVPFRREKVPVGAHDARIEFTAGGNARGTLQVEDGATASLRLSPGADELAFRPRRGASFGMALEGVVIVPSKVHSYADADAVSVQARYGGGRLSMFANIGVHPNVDLRVGAFLAAAGGSYGAKLFPAGGFFSTAFRLSRVVLVVGAQGGYSPGDEIRAYPGSAPDIGGNESTVMGSLATFGGHFGAGVALGSERRWELGLRQDFSGVAGADFSGTYDGYPTWVSTTSLGLTVLFFGRPAGATP